MKTPIQNFLLFIGGIFSLCLVYLTTQGILQQYIYFPGPLNEIGFCLCAFIVGVGCIYCGIPQRHWKKLNPFK